MAKTTKKAQKTFDFPEEYQILAADLSLRRPGFCIMKVSGGKITDVRTLSVDNKTKKKSRGQILRQIYDVLQSLIRPDDTAQFLVRQKAFNGRGAMSEIGIFQVVGIADLAAYLKDWDEIYPVSVKKLVAGFGSATKQDVESSLSHYIGSRDYANDDESDASAVAIAFLIKNNVIKGISNNEG